MFWWGWTDTPTDILPEGSARCVQSFDDSRVLQFAWRIAFHCVLHRCGSQDIRCWKCLIHYFFEENRPKPVVLVDKDSRSHNILSMLLIKRRSPSLSRKNKHGHWIRRTIGVDSKYKQKTKRPQRGWGSRDAKVNCFISDLNEWSHGSNNLLMFCFLFISILLSKEKDKKRIGGVVMILPQVHLRKPCYDFTFL